MTIFYVIWIVLSFIPGIKGHQHGPEHRELKAFSMARFKTYFLTLLLAFLAGATACDTIDNKVIPRYTVRIDLGSYALWSTYGVGGMGEYRIFNRDKQLPSNFPYNVNTYTGYGGVLLMMGIDGPLAYDLSCPVEASQDIILSISPDNFDAICPRCGSRFNPLTGGGGPLSGVAINNKVGMRQYRVMPSNGGYFISN